jgi:acetyltransferase-like isoleucine patch superfamily enzyme
MKIIKVVFAIIEYLIVNIPGGLGQKLRYIYYSKRFAKCGKNVRIDVGVIFQNLENIYVGSDVWFLPYSIITAKPFGENFKKRILKIKKNNNFDKEDGSIHIGNQTSIGSYNILQGYGGIKIGSKVTTSARVNIYSFSHYPYSESNDSLVTYANAMVDGPISCIKSPIVIKDGVWLGLSVSVFGGTIGENSFIKSFSSVSSNIDKNVIADGNPANEISKRFK